MRNDEIESQKVMADDLTKLAESGKYSKAQSKWLEKLALYIDDTHKEGVAVPTFFNHTEIDNAQR